MEPFESYFLYPSNLFLSNKPYMVNTVLGSCVAVCLYDPIKRQGGINHYMLPLWNGDGLASPKFGNIAIKRLIEAMIANGSQKISLKAKIFGGGEVIDTQVSSFKIGERNIAIAKEILEEERIPIVASSVGGKLGRKIIFNTITGEVQQKYIEKQANS